MTIVSKATISRKGHTSVEIEITKIDQSLDNQLFVITVPNKGASDLKTHVVDLQQAKEAVILQGILTDGAGANAAQTKKVNLLKLVRRGDLGRKQVTIDWGNSPYSEAAGNQMKGSILKFLVTETPGTRYQTDTSPGSDTRGFTVQLTIVRGDIIG